MADQKGPPTRQTLSQHASQCTPIDNQRVHLRILPPHRSQDATGKNSAAGTARRREAGETDDKHASGEQRHGQQDGDGDSDNVYTVHELASWKPSQLKALLTEIGLDASGCVEKRDIIDKIARHPGGYAAAAAAAAARGETRVDNRSASTDPNLGQQGAHKITGVGHAERGGVGGGNSRRSGAAGRDRTRGFEGRDENQGDLQDMVFSGANVKPVTSALDPAEQEDTGGLMGMTLADYMNRSAPVATAADIASDAVGKGRPLGRGDGEGDVRSSGRDGKNERQSSSRYSGSSAGGETRGAGSARTINPRTVRLAPSHIAPPSTPAPEWVVEMQVRCGCGTYCYIHALWLRICSKLFASPCG